MVRADADWKNDDSRHRVLDWVAVVLAVALVALYVATYLRNGHQEPIALAVILAGWTVLYFTQYWQPILYLFAAAVFGGSVVVDVVTGIPDVPFYWLVVATTFAFVAAAISLFAYEESYS